jgi:hypothetical protein
MQETAVRAPAPIADDAIEQGPWIDEEEELPRRPRRRLLAPAPVALMAILLIACGFIGGVLVEKGQTSSSSGGSIASRFAALRSGSSSSGSSGAAGAPTARGAGGFAAAGGFGAAGGITTGSVAYVVGSTLYVTTSEGNTVKVTTAPGATVSKTVDSSVAAIHPGETVVVTGTTGQGGAVAAESIRVGSTAGGLGSLFGGGGSSAGGTGTGTSRGSEQSLFGQG